jgi:hypothetical protein
MFDAKCLRKVVNVVSHEIFFVFKTNFHVSCLKARLGFFKCTLFTLISQLKALITSKQSNLKGPYHWEGESETFKKVLRSILMAPTLITYTP